ncbi:hypothetical protein CM49_04100 [Paenibacillus sp. P1XP2]|nr:hypothetical protein CM49_04100 [Paenibacillus sp. P1XP2]
MTHCPSGKSILLGPPEHHESNDQGRRPYEHDGNAGGAGRHRPELLEGKLSARGPRSCAENFIPLQLHAINKSRALRTKGSGFLRHKGSGLNPVYPGVSGRAAGFGMPNSIQSLKRKILEAKDAVFPGIKVQRAPEGKKREASRSCLSLNHFGKG